MEPGICPITVGRASMIHRWDRLTFLHWRYPVDEIQRLLPPGLTVETFDGEAWVGLVPFQMLVRPPHTPAVPWLSHFAETNVRTYVTAPDGTTGVWFLSLDAARLAAVVTARLTYRLPYYWASMTIDEGPNTISYRSDRRWPAPTPARCAADVEIGEPFDRSELTDLDHWLTARWRLFSARRHGLRYALAEHRPWELYRAELRSVDESLIRASGLRAPVGEPLVHWSPGTEVRIGWPHRVR